MGAMRERLERIETACSRKREVAQAVMEDAGIEKILEPTGFDMPALIDYEVHIPRGGKINALTECIITWEWQEQDFKTRGVDSNQVLAAVKATLRMINLRMHAEAFG